MGRARGAEGGVFALSGGQGDRGMAMRTASEGLDSASERGLRLRLDYERAQDALTRAGVEHTIVIFGSTRIPEPLAARAALDALRLTQPLDPEADPPAYAAHQRRLAVAQRVLAKSQYYGVARELGRMIGAWSKAGAQPPLFVMTGAGPGIMEAANRGAADVGAQSVGLNIVLPHEQRPNDYVPPQLCLRFHYFALRKLHFMLRARALVAFPGGYGTLDELFGALTLIQTRAIDPIPVILVGRQFWQRAFDTGFLAEEGVIDPADRELISFAEDAGQICSAILQWYRDRGRPLLSEEAAQTAPPL